MVATGEVTRRPRIIVWRADTGGAVQVRHASTGRVRDRE